MKRRTLTRYTVTIQYTPNSQRITVWGTCIEWLKEFNLARYTAHVFVVKTERVVWVGAVPRCSTTYHNH